MKNISIVLFLSVLFMMGCSSDDSSSSSSPSPEVENTNKAETFTYKPADREEIHNMVNIIDNLGSSWTLNGPFNDGGCKGSASLEVKKLDKYNLVSYEIRGISGNCAGKEVLKDRYLTEDTFELSMITGYDNVLHRSGNGKEALIFKIEARESLEALEVTFNSQGNIEYPMVARIEDGSTSLNATINILVPTVMESVVPNLEIRGSYFNDPVDLLKSLIFEYLNY